MRCIPVCERKGIAVANRPSAPQVITTRPPAVSVVCRLQRSMPSQSSSRIESLPNFTQVTSQPWPTATMIPQLTFRTQEYPQRSTGSAAGLKKMYYSDTSLQVYLKFPHSRQASIVPQRNSSIGMDHFFISFQPQVDLSPRFQCLESRAHKRI